MYNGLLIKESLNDENILDYIKIKKVEIIKTDKKIKYLTAITFTSNHKDLPKLLSKSFNDKMLWYANINKGNKKIIVIKDDVFEYEIGNINTRDEIRYKCLELGIPAKEIDWI